MKSLSDLILEAEDQQNNNQNNDQNNQNNDQNFLIDDDGITVLHTFNVSSNQKIREPV